MSHNRTNYFFFPQITLYWSADVKNLLWKAKETPARYLLEGMGKNVWQIILMCLMLYNALQMCFLFMVCILLPMLSQKYLPNMPGLYVWSELNRCKTEREMLTGITVRMQVCRPVAGCRCSGNVHWCGTAVPLDLKHKGQSAFSAIFLLITFRSCTELF